MRKNLQNFWIIILRQYLQCPIIMLLILCIFCRKKALRFQMIGFDDSAASRESRPALTTIRQDPVLRAKSAIECIEAMRDGRNCEEKILLPVELIKRESTRELSCQNL